jgi:hypothetical protein
MNKSIFQSKTIWGGIIMILPTILSFTGIDISPAEVTTGVGYIEAVVTNAAELIGFAMVIWGRFTAKTPVALISG